MAGGAIASKHKSDSASSPANSSTNIDRNSAIALSILLFLILVAIAWYLRLHFAQRRQADLERQSQTQLGSGNFEVNPVTGRVTWSRQCSSCGHGSQDTRRSRAASLLKLKSVVVRKDSVAGSSSSSTSATTPTCLYNSGDVEKRKWPGLAQWRTQDSRSTTLGPNVFAIHENTLPLTSTERPSRTHSRRQSLRGSFDPLPLHNPIYPVPARRRSSSLSQGAYDKRWWNEVARRGSTTSPTRRSSVLDAVSEPEVRDHLDESRGMSGSSTGSAHASWKGSRCESVIYDWTRPTDTQVQARGEMNFKGVIWDGQQRSRRGTREEEKIQRMDWALKM